MERIKEALRVARDQCVRTLAPRPFGTVPRVTASSLEELTYTETPVVKPDARTLARNRVITDDSAPSLRNTYKLLRTRVLQKMSANGWTSLAITSPGIGEGKTLTTINLGISLAEDLNHTVLLVDLDLRRPSLHHYLGIEAPIGIGDYLQGDVSACSLFVNPGIQRLVVIPAGRACERSATLLSSPKMNGLVRELKSRYESRLILFDLPPVLCADDALTFAPYVDATLLVIEEGKTPSCAVERTLEFLKHTELLGSVLNKVQPRAAAYY